MKKFIILITVTAIFLLVFVAGGLVAKPVDKINEKIEDVSLVVYNRCTGEHVGLTGTVYINGKLLSGELHVKCNLVGVGIISGTEYIANGILNLQIVPTGFFIFEGTGIINITCISKGEEQNFILKARACTISFYNESVYFTFIEPEIECVGMEP